MSACSFDCCTANRYAFPWYPLRCIEYRHTIWHLRARVNIPEDIPPSWDRNTTAYICAQMDHGIVALVRNQSHRIGSATKIKNANQRMWMAISSKP